MYVNRILSPDTAHCTGCEELIDLIDTNYISFYIYIYVTICNYG